MSKIKSFINSMVLSLMLLGVVGTSFVAYAFSSEDKMLSTQAQTIQSEKISNDFPLYWSDPILSNSNAWMTNDGSTFLLDNNDASVTFHIADDMTQMISGGTESSEGNNVILKNYAYIPNTENKNEYYYFDFQPSLSLYYNKTNTEIKNMDSDSKNQENLLKGEDITIFAKSFEEKDKSGVITGKGFAVPTNPSVIPQMFNMTFKINTSLTGEENIQITTSEENNKGATITVKNEGIYTLAIPVVYYHTENNGANFSTGTETFYYTFAIFNSTTYFSASNKLPITEQAHFQQSSTSSLSTYSRYYFSNYSHTSSTDTIDMPSYSYDPTLYQLTVNYTDKDELQTSAKIIFDYDEKTISFSDLNGNAISSDDMFLYASYDNDTNKIVLSFNEIGFYDLTFDFVYKFTSTTSNNQKIADHLISLDIPNIDKNSSYNTKQQRVCLYGYQIYYTDLSDIDESTGSTTPKEFKSIDENGNIIKSADITSLVNSYKSISDTNPSSNNAFNTQGLKNYASKFIKDTQYQPIQTNQTPISFQSNVKLKNGAISDSTTFESAVYKQTGLSKNGTPTFDEAVQFQGFNQSEDGTYLYIIQYTFDNFLSANGSGQASYYHYQIFYFTIASETPTVSVLRENDYQEIYTSNFTNQSVYIIDNSSLNQFDAKVEIGLKAESFSGATIFNVTDISEFATLNYEGIQYFDGNLTLTKESSTIVENARGLKIENTSPYANCKFTISIKTKNSQTASTRTFTIDTTDIGQITARNVTATSGSNYLINSEAQVSIQTRRTNQPITISWLEKASHAKTYGYYQYVPLSDISFYPSSSLTMLLRSFLVDNKTIPVNSIIDFSNYSSWKQFNNSVDYQTSIDSSYVFTAAGLYFIEVYDEAGNASFEIYFIDDTTPLFVQTKVTGGNTERSIFPLTSTLAVSQNYTVTVEWGEYKSIYLKGLSEILDSIGTDTQKAILNTYFQDKLSEDQKNKWIEKFKEYFQTSNNVKNMQIATSITPPASSNISSYSGDYFMIPISNTVYYKSAGSSKYEILQHDTNSYVLPFFNENEAIEGTFKFLLRDDSNTKGQDNEYGFTNYPSAYITVNLTSDSARMSISYDKPDTNTEPYDILESAGFSFTGNFYEKTEDGQTILSKNQMEGYSVSDKTYRYAYYSPVSTTDPLYLSFIPYANDGSMLESVVMKFYPYVKTSKQIEYTDGNGKPFGVTAYYYTLSEIATETQIFAYSTSTTYNQGEYYVYNLVNNVTKTVTPGKYVFVRTYRTDSSVANYDYYERDLTLYVDRYNVISDQESVTGGQFYTHETIQNGKTVYTVYEVYSLSQGDTTTTLYKEINSQENVYYTLVNGSMEQFEIPEGQTPSRVQSSTGLESIIGGDMLLQMYSDENSSEISISFPNYSVSSGINSGSFHTGENNDSLIFSVDTNKLPVKLNIPQYKYTLYTNYNSQTNEYGVEINNSLSQYGDAKISYNETNKVWEVIAEGITIKTFSTEKEAKDYLESTNNSSIAEYELYAEIRFIDAKGTTHYYKSGSSVTSGKYLNLYQVSSLDDDLPADLSQLTPVYFYQPGTYYVTIYQAGGNSTNKDFQKSYQFGFKINSTSPAFDVITNEGSILDTSLENNEQVAYTNSPTLTYRWFDSESDFLANIDKENIVITAFNGVTTSTIPTPNITTSGLENSFEINLENAGLWKSGAWIQVTMRYEGDNDNGLYTKTTKKVYIDYTAPFTNLANLMNSNASSSQLFDRLYQEQNMRDFYNYKNELIDSSSWKSDQLESMLQNVSYSYSKNDGIFKFYAYNVTTSYIDTLATSITTSSNTDVKYIYIRNETVTLNSYNQVTKNSFSIAAYTSIENFDKTSVIPNAYYEIVEMDRAGNMVIYLVHFQSENENIAISYTNSQNQGNLTDEEITTAQSPINIYSNSKMELTSLNFLSDPWGFYKASINGKSTYYMDSPWLEDNQIYQISIDIANGKIEYQSITIDKIFVDVESSSNKHSLTLANRFAGNSNTVLVSIMDASLMTYKITDSAQPNNAIFEIAVPTLENIQSQTTAYIFPVQIEISQYIAQTNEYNTIYKQQNLSGDPSKWVSDGGVSVTLTANSRLRLTTNLGVLGTQKLKYTIIDNFGNKTTVVQVANEEVCEEVVNKNGDRIYTINESDEYLSTTYLSSSTLRYQYNELLYKVAVEKYNKNTQSFETMDATFSRLSGTSTILYYDFGPTNNINSDEIYRIFVYELAESANTNIKNENDLQPIKVVNLRVYYRLPVETTNPTPENNEIWFKDKYNDYIDSFGKNELSVEFEGKTYSTDSATFMTTYSDNVTIYFDDGQLQNADGKYSYLDQYPYSVYYSFDNGKTWTNINKYSQTGYRISGVGEFIVFVKYDTENVLTENFKLFHITILNSSSTFYYITVDGLRVEKSDITFTGQDGKQYDTNYIISVDYSDKDSRVVIERNKELGVVINNNNSNPDIIEPIRPPENTGTNVVVEIYYYKCDQSEGYFTIIYIDETSTILRSLNYVSVDGSNESMLGQSSKTIVVSRDQQSYSKVKISWTSYYGIKENQINVYVSKLFNGAYIPVDIQIYTDGDLNYIYLERAGSYQLQFKDSCTPANVHNFGNTNYLNLIFLNYVPFHVTYTDINTGDEVRVEPTDRAIYNGDVTLTLVDLATYYNASGYPTITVTRNGQEYTEFVQENYSYTFSEPGYYKVKFSAVDKTNSIALREVEYTFTIINEKESVLSYQISPYKNYYIEQVLKYQTNKEDAVDITEDLKSLFTNNIVTVNQKEYLNQLLLSFYDEKTGGGHYIITVNTGNTEYNQVTSQTFTFEIWINSAIPPINVSIEENTSTTENITISFNTQNLYNMIGDCYIVIGSARYDFNQETLPNYSETTTITIEKAGTYYIQVYTQSGNLLYTYKVTKNDPLNAWAIIAIILGIIAVIIVTLITIKLRKRLKVK